MHSFTTSLFFDNLINFLIIQEGIAFHCQPHCYIEEHISSNAERAKVIKDQGTIAINQIQQGGSLSKKEYSGLNPVVPTGEVPYEKLRKKGVLTEETKVRELTDEEIKNN